MPTSLPQTAQPDTLAQIPTPPTSAVALAAPSPSYGVQDLDDSPTQPAVPSVDEGIANAPRLEVTPEQAQSLYDAYNAQLAEQTQPKFQKDPKKKDGGFFRWLGREFGVKGKPGETEGEKDYRITQGKQKMMLVADMLRHFGNIVNTSKYAPAQTLVSPYETMQKQFEARKEARRVAELAKLDREFKERQAQRQADYQAASLGLKAAANKLAQDRFAYTQAKDRRDYDYKVGRDGIKDDQWQRTFDANQDYRTKTLAQGEQRIKIAQTANQIRRETNAIRRANGGGGNEGYSLPTPNGRLTRKHDLNKSEMKEALKAAKDRGLISETEYNRITTLSGNETERERSMREAIASAANGTADEAASYRNYLKGHLGYKEVDAPDETPNF